MSGASRSGWRRSGKPRRRTRGSSRRPNTTRSDLRRCFAGRCLCLGSGQRSLGNSATDLCRKPPFGLNVTPTPGNVPLFSVFDHTRKNGPEQAPIGPAVAQSRADGPPSFRRHSRSGRVTPRRHGRPHHTRQAAQAPECDASRADAVHPRPRGPWKDDVSTRAPARPEKRPAATDAHGPHNLTYQSACEPRAGALRPAGSARPRLLPAA